MERVAVGAGVWVRTPRCAWNPRSDSYVGRDKCAPHTGREGKAIRDADSVFQSLHVWKTNTLTNIFQTSEGKAQQIVALGTPKRYSDSPLGPWMGMWGVVVYLQVLSEVGNGCKTGPRVPSGQVWEGFSRVPKREEERCPLTVLQN